MGDSPREADSGPEEVRDLRGFHAERTKGVYLSHDAEGESLVGKPDQMAGQFTGGDWLMRVEIDQLKPAKNKPSGE